MFGKIDAKKFHAKNRKLTRTIEELPREVANQQVNFFQANFRRQGFLDRGVKKWKRRKGNFQPQRAILTLSGDLRDDIRVIGRPRLTRIEVGTLTIPYAKRHNRGLAGMPQRQFIGDSYQLNRLTRALIRRRILQSLR